MAKNLHLHALLAGLMGCLPGNTFAMEERITLMLTDPACTQSHSAISATLEETSGVRHVDLHAIPSHALIDIEAGTVTAEALKDQVNGIFATHPSCHAEIMKSCISADPQATSIILP